MALALLIRAFVSGVVSALHVRPNEISLERPYIESHIHATRSAFGIEQRVREVEFKSKVDAPVDVAAHKQLLDNVRLWDTRAFHDTVTQIIGDDGKYHDYPLQLVKDVNALKAIRTNGVDLDALAEKIDAMVKARVAEVTGTTGHPL